MAEAMQWKTVYMTTTAPVDEAGNFYTPALVPANLLNLPANVTELAPTEAQIAAGKALKFDWSNQVYVESGEDPLMRQLAAVNLQLAKQTQASNAQMATLALQLAKATAADDKPAAPVTDDGTAATQPKEA